MVYRYESGSIADVLRVLKGNAAVGLTHKEARSRYGKMRLTAEKELFRAPKRPFSRLLGACVSDFSFWLLLLTAGTLAFFENTRLAWVAVAFLFLHLAFSVTAFALSDAVSGTLLYASRPKVKVVREGKLFLSDCRYVVRGDVVLLSKGDVVPFDARLLNADSLTVSVLCGYDETGKERFVTCQKDPNARLDGRREHTPEERTNMVTAGSTILEGSARAIVTETGSYTYIGTLTGGIALGGWEAGNDLTHTVSARMKSLGILLLLLTVPLTALAYFLGEPHDLAISFLTVLSLSAAVLPGGIVSLLELSAAREVRRFVRAESLSEGALPRSASACEALASLDVLMLFGTAMLTDGHPRVIGVFSEGGFFTGGELSAPPCRALTEKALLLAERATRLPTRSDDPNEVRRALYRKELFGYAEFVEADREMLGIRYRVTDYRAPTREEPVEAISYTEAGGVPRHLFCAYGEALLRRCTEMREGGAVVSITPERRKRLEDSAKTARSRGGTISAYAERGEDGVLVLLGFIAYAELVPKGTKAAFEKLTSMGVRTLLVLPEDSPAGRCIAYASGVVGGDAEIASATRFRKEEKTISDGFGTYSAYLGFSREEVGTLIRTLEEGGLRTGVVVLEDEDAPLMRDASLSIACGEGRVGRRPKEERELLELPLSGVRFGAEASECVKLDADLLAPRPSKRGGGLAAIIRTVALGRRIDRSRKTILVYLITTFGLHLGWLLPSLWGLGDLSASLTLLFAGLIFDFLAGLVLLCDDRADETIVRAALRKPSEIRREVAMLLVSGAVTGFVLSFLPCLLSLFGAAPSPAAVSVYRGIALFVASLVFLLRLRLRRSGSHSLPRDGTR